MSQPPKKNWQDVQPYKLSFVDFSLQELKDFLGEHEPAHYWGENFTVHCFGLTYHVRTAEPKTKVPTLTSPNVQTMELVLATFVAPNQVRLEEALKDGGIKFFQESTFTLAPTNPTFDPYDL